MRYIPKGDAHFSSYKITREQRDEIARRLAAGETQTSLSREFGISRQAISLLRKRLAEKEAAGGLGKNLSDEERERLREVLLSTKPDGHKLGVRGNPLKPNTWTRDHAFAMAVKIAGRPLFKNPINKLFAVWFPPATGPWLPPDDDAAAHEVSFAGADPSILRDKKFREYLASPVAAEIRRRELAQARARHDTLQAKNPPAPPQASPAADMPAHGVRTGKHKLGKGLPFTKPKKKKKKKK